MGSVLSTVLLDSHVVHWWASEPEKVSANAAEMIEAADETAISGVSWYELAWLASRDRIILDRPMRTWLAELSGRFRTVGLTADIAATAADLPRSFPGDPADRLIYATAIETGWPLVTRDRRLLDHPHPRQIAFW